jgi:hypothetical protein
MLIMHRVLPRLVAILTLVAAGVVVAVPAGAATGSVQVGPTAALVANGVALDLPVTISLACDEGFTSGVVDVFVTQARGTEVIFGEGIASFTCTSEAQRLDVRVFGGVFHGGPALGAATLLQCRFEEGCGTVCYYTGISTNGEILIRAV